MKSMEDRFLDIIEENKKLIFKIANSYSNDHEDRKDLAQEIILQLYKAFPKYNDDYAITTWIYRIALNISISFYRKEKSRKRTKNAFQQVIELVDESEDIKNEQVELLNRFIENLNSIDKAIIILFLEGRKNKEIADIMGFSVSNVSTRMNRIKIKLRSNVKSINK